MGHSHRRAVLLLYFWSALLALGGVALSIYRGVWVVVTTLVVAAVAAVVSVVPGLRTRRGQPLIGRVKP
jgi:UDP-GlcNAc:undecaprenyl-phosphate GlcNAc-1-phosphate transferase